MRSVIVTRARDRAGELIAMLEERGFHVYSVPAVAIELLPVDPKQLTGCDWIVLTSAEGVKALPSIPAGARVAAVGEATAKALRGRGIEPTFVPAVSNDAALGHFLPDVEGKRVVLVRGSLAGADLPESLRRRGATVTEVTAYRTIEGPTTSRSLLADALAHGVPAAVVFASGSAVRGFVALGGPRLPAVSLGPSTTSVIHELGFEVVAEAERQNAESLADAVASALLQEEKHA